MPRNVDVPLQKVWGSIPLQLPLVKMSEAEGIYLEGQPQIYDTDYPLDWSGLDLNPKWWENTGVGTSLNGLGISAGQQRINQARTNAAIAARQSASAKRLAMMQQRQAETDARFAQKHGLPIPIFNPNPPVVDPGRPYPGLPLPAPPVSPTNQAQAYCNAIGGTWANGTCTSGAPTTPPVAYYPAPPMSGMDEVGGGNVRLMPWEKGYGFSGLGLTAAQQAAQARAAANKAAALAKKQAAQAAKQQAQAAKVAAKPTLPVKATTATKTPTQAQLTAAAKKSCTAQGGVWDASTNSCGPNPKQTACTSGGGTWANGACTPGAAQTQCQQGGGTWANGVCTPSAGQSACQTNGDTWSNGSCVQSNAHIQCLSTTPPGTWANGQCTPAVVASKCATAPTSCQTGYIFGTDANGCTVCVVDPNASTNPATNPAIAQCQQTGGYWNGSYCAPPQTSNYPPPDMSAGGAGGGGFPPPSPSYDPTQGGAPIMSQGATGGGLPMTQGQGPVDLSDQTGYGQPVDPSTQDDSSGGDSGDQSSDSGTTDDTAGVASSNILESIAKLFSGMGSLNCGCNAPPPWFNTQLGGNAPTPQQFFTARPNQQVSPAISSGVILGSAVLIAGAAALFIWSKGKK